MTAEEARKRARELVGRMTVEEKASLLRYRSPAIDRLGIKEYCWWNEASHGVARAGMATVFPHAIAMAATFDPELVGKIGEAVSTEARAKYNNSIEKDDRDIYKGLTYWTPNINIFRDPRWGRGQETFGEDPYLTSAMAVSYIKGLQGDGEFLRSSACAKHFAVHSGPESERHTFDAEVSQKDLWETYLPAFEKAVGCGVSGVMGAYNRLLGHPCCAHPMIKDIIRDKWGFDGYFVSDCGAIHDIYATHKYSGTAEEAMAAALNAGCEVNCGDMYDRLMDAYEKDLITEETITEAAVSALAIRFRLGEFEEKRPYSDIPFEKTECAEFRELNLQAARECMVLLKNDGILPLDRDTDKKIAVIGPNAMSVAALEGNYNGRSSENVTVADGIRRVFRNADVRTAMGSRLYDSPYYGCNAFYNMKSEGVGYAERADVTVLVLGLDPSVEGEENGITDDLFCNGDRKALSLPAAQREMAEEVCRVCDNVIVVVMAGSAVDIGSEIESRAGAVIHAWYPGAEGGLAAAELIAGLYSPSGRLPVTFYRESEELPDFRNYSMKGRTYRFFGGEPLYPFGYGLSYTEFEYSDAEMTGERDGSYTLSFTLANTGKMDGAECVSVYASFTDSRTDTPRYQLAAVRNVFLRAGESVRMEMEVEKYWCEAVLEDGTRTAPDGKLEFYVGGSQPDQRSTELTGKKPVRIAAAP